MGGLCPGPGRPQKSRLKARFSNTASRSRTLASSARGVQSFFEPQLEHSMYPRPFACAAHPAVSPRAGCESHDFCPPVCAGSKLNIHPVHAERGAASLAGAGAHRAPIRLVGARAGSPSSPLPARHRTARDSLCGSRRPRAALMLSRCELSCRAFPFACTFGLPRREL